MLLEYKKVDKWISIEDNSRLQKTTVYHERVRRYKKESQLIYSDSQRCLYIAQKDLEHEKVDQQMSVSVVKGHRAQINWKMQKKRALKKLVLLQ